MSEAHEWRGALHDRSLTDLPARWLSERERSLQASSPALGPNVLFPSESEKSLCVGSLVALADAPPKVACYSCKPCWCFPEVEERGLTKCGVLWLLRNQPAFEASGQGPEPTEKSAAGQEVLTAQWHAQTIVGGEESADFSGPS